MIPLLLAAAPAAARMADDSGRLPLHAAAECGHAGAARLLLAAAPDAVAAESLGGRTPLDLALRGRHIEAGRLLVAAGPAPAVLSSLVTASRYGYSPGVHAGAFVAAHMPLSEQQWSQLAHVARAVPRFHS